RNVASREPRSRSRNTATSLGMDGAHGCTTVTFGESAAGLDGFGATGAGLGTSCGALVSLRSRTVLTCDSRPVRRTAATTERRRYFLAFAIVTFTVHPSFR